MSRYASQSHCDYCGLDFAGQVEAPLILEHVVPRSRGGADTPDNFKIACTSCNAQKSSRTLEEWRAVLSRRFGVPVSFRFEAGAAPRINMPWGHIGAGGEP